MKINDDLINQIKQSNRKPKFTMLRKQVKYTSGIFCLYTFFNFILGYDLTESLISSGYITTIFMVFQNLIDTPISVIESYKQAKAEETEIYRELLLLSIRLVHIGINAAPDLLKNAELVQTEYNIIPPKQTKHLLVPTKTPDEEQTFIHLVQEHPIGRKGYNLSEGSLEEGLRLKIIKKNKFSFFNKNRQR